MEANARVTVLGDRPVGYGHPCYIVAEIGINHNGDLAVARRLIDAARDAGCDAVKFQKRTPDLATPVHMRDRPRETPWGTMTYLEYRRRVEFDGEGYATIDRHCRATGIAWFASCWDEPSVDFMEAFDPPCYKIHSAAVTDTPLLERVKATGRPVVLSTGMSEMAQIRAAVRQLAPRPIVLTHSTSTYPCPPDELNLSVIGTLRREFALPVGYSGHEAGLPTTVAAVALGACYVERHLTLDRAMWGTDQAASVEPQGFARLVHYIRTVEAAMGDGVKRVYDSELPVMARLRRAG